MIKYCIICSKQFKTSHQKIKCCSRNCGDKSRQGQIPWNKGKRGLQIAWNKGKTNIYSKETRRQMGAKNKRRRRSINTEFKKGENVGSKHRLWKGIRADYTSIHSWVSRWKGRPKKCEHCGITTKQRYEWANINNKYRRQLEDYIRLCKSCHTKFDFDKKVEIEVEKRLKDRIKVELP